MKITPSKGGFRRGRGWGWGSVRTVEGQPAGAWVDLFDPAETPFGATRRSISVGREPMEGAVTADGSALFFPDRASRTATLLSVGGTTDTKQTTVDASPEAGFLMDDDHYGVTINSASRSASILAIPPRFVPPGQRPPTMDLKRTLMSADLHALERSLPTGGRSSSP